MRTLRISKQTSQFHNADAYDAFRILDLYAFMILDAPDGRGRQYHWLQHLTHRLPFTAEGRRVLFIPVNPRLFFSDEQ